MGRLLLCGLSVDWRNTGCDASGLVRWQPLHLPLVNYAITVPGPAGQIVAFVAEMVISCTLMAMIVTFTSPFPSYTQRLQTDTLSAAEIRRIRFPSASDELQHALLFGLAGGMRDAI